MHLDLTVEAFSRHRAALGAAAGLVGSVLLGLAARRILLARLQRAALATATRVDDEIVTSLWRPLPRKVQS